MTRTQAIAHIKAGKVLSTIFYPEIHGVSGELEVWISYQPGPCQGFTEEKKPHHQSMGPFHVRFWSKGWPHWIHISSYQALNFIRRNYPR